MRLPHALALLALLALLAAGCATGRPSPSLAPPAATPTPAGRLMLDASLGLPLSNMEILHTNLRLTTLEWHFPFPPPDGAPLPPEARFGLARVQVENVGTEDYGFDPFSLLLVPDALPKGQPQGLKPVQAIPESEGRAAAVLSAGASATWSLIYRVEHAPPGRSLLLPDSERPIRLALP